MKSKVGLYLLFVLVSFGGLASERSEQAWQQVEKGALLIDVRTPEEFKQGHLVGAINKPLSTLDSTFSDIDKNTPVVVYCRSGNRSGKAMNYLHNLGFLHIYNGGGFEEMNLSK